MSNPNHKEWIFEFGLSHKDGMSGIPENDAQNLMDVIIEWAEDKGLYVGGGYKPYEDK